MNKSSGRFLSEANTSDVIGTNVVTVPQTTADTARWTYDNDSDYLHNGKKATLTNVSSPTGKMLDVEGVNVDIWNHTGSGCQHFTVYRTNNPNYPGLYCIRYGPYFVTQHTDNNVYLSTTAIDASFWSFMKVDKGGAYYASTYTVSYEEQLGETGICNIGVYGDYFASTMNLFGYNSSHQSNPSANTVLNHLYDDDIVVIAAHCEPGQVGLYNQSNQLTGIIWAHSDIAQPGSGNYFISSTMNNELSDLSLVLYLGCSSGVDYVDEDGDCYNLVDIAYEMGAHYAFGASDTIYESEVNVFSHELLVLSENANNCPVSLGQAIDIAMDNAMFYTFTYKVQDENGNYLKDENGEYIRITDTCDFPYYSVGDTEQLIYF